MERRQGGTGQAPALLTCVPEASEGWVRLPLEVALQPAPSQARLRMTHPRSSGVRYLDQTRDLVCATRIEPGTLEGALVGGAGLPGLGARWAGWRRGRTLGWGECRVGCGGGAFAPPSPFQTLFCTKISSCVQNPDRGRDKSNGRGRLMVLRLI